MGNLKYETHEPTYETETESHVKNRFVVAKGMRGEEEWSRSSG